MEPEHCPWLHGSNPKNGYEMLWSRKGACGSMGSSIQNEHMEPEIAWWIHNRRVHFWRMFEHPVDEFRREATMEPQTTVWLHTARLHFMVDPSGYAVTLENQIFATCSDHSEILKSKK